MPAFSAAVNRSNLVVRTGNTTTDLDDANTFASFEELEGEVILRVDSGLWESSAEDLVVRAIVAAYLDIIRLTWATHSGNSQSRDYEFSELFSAENSPPMGDNDFLRDVKRAQAAQVMYILGGTQVRDMAAQGIRVTKTLANSEMEIIGYRGAVCTEAKEILARWIEMQPRMRRMQ